MKNKILELEKSLFKYEYMTDIAYLNEIIDDQYIEVGKSGKQFNKEDVIKELSILKEDRKISIYNYTCCPHYFLLYNVLNIFFLLGVHMYSCIYLFFVLLLILIILLLHLLC